MFDRTSLKTTGFSWEKSLALAMASQLAYLQSPAGVVHVATQTWGFKHCGIFAGAYTLGFVAWDDDVVVISFRGTENVGNWLSNLDLISTTRSYGKVHEGFYRAFEVARLPLEEILHSAGARGKTVWLTGHSLGGALAMVAAAEMFFSLNVAGIYTFGQPKTGDAVTAQFFEKHFHRQFHRFVNDDDIVPRVPPGYSHVGQLIWFNQRGELKRFDEDGPAAAEAEETAPTARPHELNEPEFRELQLELKTIEAVTGGEPELFERSVEGFVPSLADHAIGRYVSRIARFTSRPAQISRSLEEAIGRRQQFLAGVESVGLPRHASFRGEGPVPVLLRVRSSVWEPPAGLTIQSRLGTILTARCTLPEIEALKEDADVVSVEVSRAGGVAELARSVPFVGGSDVQAPPFHEHGDGAIVAVIDTGLDVLHEAFRDAAGNTRIVALWNQKLTPAGRDPHSVDSSTYSQTYGRLYLASEIQQMIARNTTPLPDLRDPLQHGTHVASIAAGRAAGAFAGGMAPEAKIVMVIPDMVTEPGGPASVGYSNSHVDALAFIRATAEKLKLPVVVNVSLGMNAGAHDGTSTLEAAFDQFSGSGRDPGFVVVKSAGNERGRKGHAKTFVALDAISELVWDSSPVNRETDYIEVWFSGFDEMAFTLIDPAGHRSGVVSAQSLQDTSILGGNYCDLHLTRFHRDNGDNLLTIEIRRDTDSIQTGRWTLELNGLSIATDGQVHAWVERESDPAVRFASGDADEMTLSIPATARTVLTVGACGAEIPLRLTDASSWGLTRDGRTKPDLCAPGRDIVAARSNQNDHQATCASTGTSMAAPHVAGAVALLLSWLHKHPTRRQVNAQQVHNALVRTTRVFSGRHNNRFGFGVLDTLAFLNLFHP